MNFSTVGAGDEIEPALPAWEVHRLRLVGLLARVPGGSWVTVVGPSSPWLITR